MSWKPNVLLDDTTTQVSEVDGVLSQSVSTILSVYCMYPLTRLHPIFLDHVVLGSSLYFSDVQDSNLCWHLVSYIPCKVQDSFIDTISST